MHLLSAKARPQLLEKLNTDHFDLTIIGGGITGAGIALDAASRGLKVALIEQRDFGSGTSSKSTKLIHGGLRYLKQFEVQLVREVGQERATVHQLAPHLVLPEKMMLPLIKGGTYGPWATSIGLKVYDFLAGVKGKDQRKMLTREASITKEPLLRTNDLIGGGYYAEYRTDDARLTIENIKTAQDFGAVCANYVQAKSFIYSPKNRIQGVNCQEVISGQEIKISSDYVISAAGPWVDQLREKDNSLSGKHLFLSKGVHIVVPFEKLPLKQSIYFDNTDGRMLFAIPRGRSTYIGTTDTPYEGDLNKIPITLEDVQYLLAATQQMFPKTQLGRSDVESSWAGLRPLIYEAGKSGSEMSRKDEIFSAPSGLISIAGGKLTGYRKMAERVIDFLGIYLAKDQNITLPRSKTKSIPLAGGVLKNSAEVESFQKEISQTVLALDLPKFYSGYLVANYGAATTEILAKVFPMEKGENPELKLLQSELHYCLDFEGVLTAEDFLNRRTGRMYFNMPSVLAFKEEVLQAMQKALNWEENRLADERQILEQAIELITTFPETSKKVLA